MQEEKEPVMLSELISDRILRHNYSTTLGLHIKSVTAVTGDTYIIRCKYLSLNDEKKGMNWSAKEDSFVMPLTRFMNEFSVLENPKEIKSFSQGNWVSMNDLQILANSNGKEIV